MDPRICLLLLCGMCACNQVEALSLVRETKVDPATFELVEESEITTTEEPASGPGPRQPFSLTGPSLDFQQGSVMSSPAELSPEKTNIRSSYASQRSQGGDSEFGDYDEFGSRVHSDPVAIIAAEKKPIYVKKTPSKSDSSGPVEEITAESLMLDEVTTFDPVNPEDLEVTTAETDSTVIAEVAEFDADVVDEV